MLNTENIFNEKYKIKDVIGKGGMGCVYLAEDIQDHSIWAIKEAEINEKNEQLLYQEAEILSRLEHSALPKIRQYIRQEEYFYIVMEYIEGRTLEKILNDHGKIAEPLALKWFRQICDILIYLHGLEIPIVYRDLKPSNIMLLQSGDVKLIDFGIAQEYGQNESTGKKVMALTRGYAAPEQYDKRYKTDVRTDIYALGVTMHYMLTGKNPNKPPYNFRAIRKLNPDLSRAMEYIVKKCLQPNPDKRFENAVLLQKQLGEIQQLEDKLKRKRKIKILGSIVGTVLIISITLGTFLSVKQKREAAISYYYMQLDQAEAHIVEEDYQEALDLYEKAINVQPEATDAYIGIARVYFKQKEYEKCHEYLRSIAEKFPDIFEDTEFIELTNALYEIDVNN